MKIFCCHCQKKINARLTDGAEIYPHRPDLSQLPFWKCDDCGNHVGCHHKTSSRTRPLGVIPTEKVRSQRRNIHNALDPIWKRGFLSRSEVYKRLTKALGWRYHTANIKSTDDAKQAYEAVMKIRVEVGI